MTGAEPGPDGRARCPWALSVRGAEDYLRYHDREWGRPIRTDQGLYERLVLEAFQSGLAWLTILRKRPAFREAFDGFDPKIVAEYGADARARLLTDDRIVRNRAKIDAAIANARACLELDQGLAALLWSFAPDATGRAVPRTVDDVPARTPASQAMATALKRAGFVFVGPTTCYALMQAAGLVDDHLEGCWVRGAADGT